MRERFTFSQITDALRSGARGADLALRCGAMFGNGGGGLGVEFMDCTVADWPQFEGIKAKAKTSRHTFAAAELLESLEFMTPAISTEETRYYLNGIYIHQSHMADVGDGTGTAGILRMVATDGHRLHLRTFTESAFPDMRKTAAPSVILPRCAVALMVKALRLYGPDDAAELEWSEERIVFRIGRVVIASKTIDGTFPDYPRVIPSRDNDKAKRFELAAADRPALESGYKLAMARGESNKSGPQILVWPNRVGFPVWQRDCVDLVACFNGRYLMDSIGDNAARLAITGEGDPARVEFPDHAGRLAVLMPMRSGPGYVSVPEHPDDKVAREAREAAERAEAIEREAAKRAKVQADKMAKAAERGEIPAGPVIAFAPITPDGTETPPPVMVHNVDNASRMDSWCAILQAPKAARGVDVPSWDRCAPPMAAAVWCAAFVQSLAESGISATVTAPPPDGYMTTPPALGNVVELAPYRAERWQPGAMRPANDDDSAIDLAAIAARPAPWHGIAGYGDD